MDFSPPDLYQRRCDRCGGDAYWVLEDERIGTRVRCAECGPPEAMEIPKIGYCCESCNGPLEGFVRRLGPRHNRVVRSGDLVALVQRLEAEKVPILLSYRNPDFKVPMEERGLEAVTVVRS